MKLHALSSVTVVLSVVTAALAQDADAPSSSLMAAASEAPASAQATMEPHALRSVSMFAVAPNEARIYHEHDLIQIIVREATEAKTTQELDTNKELNMQGAVSQWPDMQLSNLLQGQLKAGSTDQLPQLDFQWANEYKGDGEYQRRDDFTARLTAEVIEVLPNGNLILESRTRVSQDKEEYVLKVTGICRPDDVTPANTILSNQLHDLTVDKLNSGEVKKGANKGLLTKILDAVFAF